MPVVSSSSPPESHAVGSASSEMCTQRTGASAASSPATSSSPRSRASSRTVSIRPRSSSALHLLPGLLERRAQDRLDLGEVLGAGDERRGGVGGRGAAGAGAGDQAAGGRGGRRRGRRGGGVTARPTGGRGEATRTPRA